MEGNKRGGGTTSHCEECRRMRNDEAIFELIGFRTLDIIKPRWTLDFGRWTLDGKITQSPEPNACTACPEPVEGSLSKWRGI